MEISTTTEYFYQYGDTKKVLLLLKESGFTAFDLSMCGGEWHKLIYLEEYKDLAKELRIFADSISFPCNQTHAPFPSAKRGDEAYNEKIFPILVRAIEISGIMGAKVCVIHPCNDYTPEENAVLYNRLAPYAKKANVKIGVENMWNGLRLYNGKYKIVPAACAHQDDYFAHMELLDKEVFCACVDIGHAELMRDFDASAVKIIKKLGGYMQAMHLHDVDFANDNHAYPFSEKIEYAPIIQALKEVGYSGDITMEAGIPARNVPTELLSAVTKYLAEIANYFKTQIEK